MSEQYFEKDPTSTGKEERHEAVILGNTLSFITDRGVFSKDGTDPGSLLLIRASCDVSGKVLDLGCGWGEIGIALKKADPGLTVTFCDINSRACALCERNLKENGISGLRVIQSDGFENIDEEFDHILLNPPVHAGKEVMYRLFREAKEHLAENGTFRIVMMTRQGASSAEKEMKAIYGNCVITERGSGYKVMVSEKKTV